MIVSTLKQDKAMQILREIVGDNSAVYDGILSISKEDIKDMNSEERLWLLLGAIARYAVKNDRQR